MNRILDRKIAAMRERVARAVETERVTLVCVLAEVASGDRQIELEPHHNAALRLQQCMAQYNALVELRTELGE
jgi:hypothetical protein